MNQVHRKLQKHQGTSGRSCSAQVELTSILMSCVFPIPQMERRRKIGCENNVEFNFNENKKILNDSRHSVLNWPYYEQLLKNFQDNELSHLPYNKLWADCSDIIALKKKKTHISMAPIIKKKSHRGWGYFLNQVLCHQGSEVSWRHS